MKIQYRPSGPIFLGHSTDVPVFGHQLDLHRLIYSTGNPINKKTGFRRSGGGFLVQHYTNSWIAGRTPTYIYNGRQYGGSTIPTTASFVPVIVPEATSLEDQATNLNFWGTKGFARTRPGNPILDGAVFVGELRDLPKIPFSDIWRGPLMTLPRRFLHRLAFFRRLGSEYLNLAFGWAPFVRDLITMHKLTEKIDRQLAHLRRNNGKSNRREIELKDTTEVSREVLTVNGPFAHISPRPIIIGGGFTERIRTTTSVEKIWFVGRYRYYVPNIGTLEWERKATKALYGGNLTPDVAWNLLPWSWLIDWFANVGDIMSNMSQNAIDNTVAEYAYIMRNVRTTVKTEVWTRWGARTGSPADYPAGSTGCSHTIDSELKMRMAASPYGFGVAWTGLSPFQMSIVGALGLSRQRFI